MTRTFDVIVVGGGVLGLCTAWQLARRGVGRVALVERFQVGHRHGSSHGHSRITRTAYVEQSYVRLMQEVHSVDWPELQAALGERLIHPSPGCLFGPAEGPFHRYADAVLAVGVDVDLIDAKQAQRRFPQFRFGDAEAVLDDHTAGVIAAERTIAGLRTLLPEMGVSVVENNRVLAIDPVADPVVVDTDQGRFEAGRVVVTAGPWAGRLIPGLAGRLQAIRQTVTYWTLDGTKDGLGLGRFPVWVYLGVGRNDTYYGLPSFGEPGIKAARFVHDGVVDDPDRLDVAVAAADVERVRRLLGEQLRPKIGDLIKTETCYFTNTETEDYILDEAVSGGRVVVGAGLSGHGFKLAPLSGRILAGLATTGETGVAAFDGNRARFRVGYGGT